MEKKKWKRRNKGQTISHIITALKYTNQIERKKCFLKEEEMNVGSYKNNYNNGKIIHV